MRVKLYKYSLMAVGCLIIGFIFYFRVLYVRLPRDIVQEYNWLILLSYINICIFNLIRAGSFDFILLFFPYKHKENKFMLFFKKLRAIFYKPFAEIRTTFLSWDRATILLTNIILIFYSIFKYSCYLPYSIFNILPRLIFLVALSIDFWNLYFYRMYQALPLLLIPIIYEIIIRFANEITIAFLKESHENTFSFIWFFDKGFDLLGLFGFSSHFTMQPWAQPFPGYTREVFTNLFHNIYKSAVFSSIALQLPQYDPKIITFNTFYYYCVGLLWGLILLTILLS